MCLLVLLLHFICTEWHTEATESRKYEYDAFYIRQKLKLTSSYDGCIGYERGGGVTGPKVSTVHGIWIIWYICS